MRHVWKGFPEQDPGDGGLGQWADTSGQNRTHPRGGQCVTSRGCSPGTWSSPGPGVDGCCSLPRQGNVSSWAILPTWVPFRTTMFSEEKLVFSLRLMEGEQGELGGGSQQGALWQTLTLAVPCRELEHREDDAHLPAGRQSPPPGPSPHRQPRAPASVRGPLCGHADTGLEHLPLSHHRGLPRVRLGYLSRERLCNTTCVTLLNL